MDSNHTPDISKQAPAPGNKAWYLRPWFYPLIACFILLFLFSFRLISDFDLGYHLKSGQWILQHHAFPDKDPFTYTSASRDYVDTYWLYQTALYIFYRLGSYTILTWANALLLALAFYILYVRMRAGGIPLWIGVPLFLTAILGSETRFIVRPEIVTFFWLGLTLLLLERRIKQKCAPLFLLPLIQLVWVNMHGLFILGWLAMAAFLLTGWLNEKRIDKELFKYSALSAAASFLNPYFLKGVLFPFQLFTRLNGTVLKANIAEFQSPWAMHANGFYLFTPGIALNVYKAVSVICLILLLVTFKKRKAHEIILGASFIYLSATAVKNVPLFFIAALPVMGQCLKDLEWGAWRKTGNFLSAKKWVPLSLCGIIILTGLRVITSAYYISDRREDRFGAGLDEEKEPQKSVEFLIKNKLDGVILNQMNSGGWLDWQAPQKTFIDGRTEVMGDDFFKEYMTSFNPGGLARLAEKYKADIIFFNPFAASAWILYLKQMPDWRLVYLDEYFAIYLRKDYAPQVTVLDDGSLLKEEGIQTGIAGDAYRLIQLAHPGFGTWLEGFYRPQYYPDGLFTMAMSEFYNSHFETAEALFLETIRRTGGKYYEFELNLGSMYYYMKKYDYSRICMEHVLEEAPNNSVANQIMSMLPR